MRIKLSSFAVAGFIFLLIYRAENMMLSICVATAAFLAWNIADTHNHNQKASIEKFDKSAVSSGLRNISSELKMFVAILGIVVSVSISKWYVGLGIALIMFFVNIFGGKIKFHDYIEFLTIPTLFIVMSGIVLLFDISPDALGVINIPFFQKYLVITKENQQYTAVIIAKVLGSVSSLYMMSLSTPLYEIIVVLNKCHIPDIIIELMYLIYRFIFILIDLLENMTVSANSRLGYKNNRCAFSTFSCVASNLLSVSFLKSSKMYDAMESRCYDGKLSFLTENHKFCKKDIIFGLSVILPIVILILI